jgi:beta-N-acetylhexosaminidase
MQSAGVLACAKHFPGHGDTSVDSHCALPLVPHSRERLDEIEFAPFRKAIEEGVGAIMSAHLLVPAIDPDKIATLSFACLTDILRTELGFEGLIISDALNMRALSQTPEEIAVEAFQAGCDLLLYGDHIAPNIDKILREDIPRAWNALKKGFEEETLSQTRLNDSVAKILRAKERLGLHLSTKLNEIGLVESLHSEEASRLKKTAFREAIILEGELWPLPEKTACLTIGGPDEMSKAFSAVFSASPNLNAAQRRELMVQLEDFDAVVVAIHQFEPREQNYGFSPDCIDLIHSLPRGILCLFGTPYSIPVFSYTGPLLIGFENDPDAQEAVLDILQGRQIAKGINPDVFHRGFCTE